MPKWLTKIIGRENRLFNARLNKGWPGNGSDVTHHGGTVVVGLSGSYTSPKARCNIGCPVPMRGNFLRLVISTRTHRVERVRLIEEINPFAAARRSSGYLSIFPDRPRQTPCQIPRGGLSVAGSMLAGHCASDYTSATRQSAAAHAVRIRFDETWRTFGRKQHAAWIVTVRYRDGAILDTQIEGDPPQLWR